MGEWQRDPLRATTYSSFSNEKLKEQEELQFTLSEMQTVTCPKCGTKWRYRGNGRALKCVNKECTWSDASPIWKQYQRQGLCHKCHDFLSPRSKWYCERCLVKNNERSKARYQRKKLEKSK